MNKKYLWPSMIGVLIVALLAFNFLNFHVARSNTVTDFSLGTGRSGETLPQNMANGFRLAYQVTSSERLAEPLQQALHRGRAYSGWGFHGARKSPGSGGSRSDQLLVDAFLCAVERDGRCLFCF